MKPLRDRPFSRELYFKTAGSSGPGGQHVNKANTRVMLRFDIDSSALLGASEKQRIKNKLSNYITTEGVLIVESEETRSQYTNKKRATEKFYSLLEYALKRRKRRIRTRPPQKAKERRLQKKKKRGEKKQTRRKDKII